MYIGLFKPMVMFFGLTNLPAIFQTTINDIFYDLINKGDIVTFINNILAETEKGYNELIEKILKRLEEHNLYIKPKKCK